MGGKGPEVLVTLTTDFGKILDGIHRTKIKGDSHLVTSIQVAGVGVCLSCTSLDSRLTLGSTQLALQHRQNTSQRKRIIVFICSPVLEDEKTLVQLALKMKKINVSIDFIVFGELDEENIKKLQAFNDNVKGGEGSHMEIIPPGPNLLSDALVSTPILQGEGVTSVPGGGDSGGGGADAGSSGFEFGVDPSTDPELALALRMSFEEEKARQEKERKDQEEKEGKTNLEGIREEDEATPLIDKEGDKPNKPKEDKAPDKEDQDKMDTA